MQDEEFNLGKFQTLTKFISEINGMQQELNERDKIKVALEMELSQLKGIEEDLRAVKTSLEEQLANSNAERNLLSEKLEHEVKERKRIEEEFCAVKISLEEQLAKRDSEIERIANNHKNEQQTMKLALDNLQLQFKALYKL